MAYATQTKTCRRKSMSPKQFRSSPTHLAKRPIEDALQNLGSKTVILINTNDSHERTQGTQRKIGETAKPLTNTIRRSG
jgi:hypothetical protein